MVSLTLDALGVPLDRSLLHVFVAGPGYGEGIAVDGCRVSTGRLPILAILDRWRSPSEPVDALLLTHPHTDHAFGIRETIEAQPAQSLLACGPKPSANFGQRLGAW